MVLVIWVVTPGTPSSKVIAHLARILLWLGRFALFAKAFWIFGQIITFIVVLGISSRQDCDRPLRIFLSVEVARIAIAWPLSFYSTLMPPRCEGIADCIVDSI